MLQKPWFKIFVWFISVFFFFLASGVIISIFKPGPSESEVMQFMMGMMSAMDNSMMGVAMNMGGDGIQSAVIRLTSASAVPILLISIVVGFLIRLKNRGNSNV